MIGTKANEWDKMKKATSLQPFKDGALGRIRTSDRLVRSQVLFSNLSLLNHRVTSNACPNQLYFCPVFKCLILLLSALGLGQDFKLFLFSFSRLRIPGFTAWTTGITIRPRFFTYQTLKSFFPKITFPKPLISPCFAVFDLLYFRKAARHLEGC